jgi:soluble lytic murein transglycosylase-like protein/Flp pilus assembly protein TadD
MVATCLLAASATQAAHARPTWTEAREAYWSGAIEAEGLLRALAESGDGSTASAVERRDAWHLLARLLTKAGRTSEAVVAWREALMLGKGKEAPSALTDLLAFGLADALVRSDSREAEAVTLASEVEGNPWSPLRADAAFLRARQLERLGRTDEAKKAYKSVLERWPDASFAREVKVRIGALDVARGAHVEALPELMALASERGTGRSQREAELLVASLGGGGDAELTGERRAPRVSLAQIRQMIEARQFDLTGPALAPWLVPPADPNDREAMDTWLDAHEVALEDQWENFRFTEALATNALLQKNKRPGLSKYRMTRLYALDGEFDKAVVELKKRYRGGRGKAYLVALGDLAFEFARYQQAYDAYTKAFGKRVPDGEQSERLTWCLLRMGQADKAAKRWEKLGKTRGFNRNLFDRYWYARAQQIAGKPGPAKKLFEALVEDAPLEYYGLQAWSRIQEMDGTVPAMVQPSPPKVPRKGDEPEAGRSTVGWTTETLAGAFDRAPRPAPMSELEPRAEALAATYGSTVEETRRAAELVHLGDVSAAIDELRVVDMDLRALRSSGGSLQSRARSDLLDNRGSPKTRGGGSMRETGPTRKSAEQAARMKREAGALRKDLREVQTLLADPYSLRRSVLESASWTMTPELLAKQGPRLYPIAYPDVVRPLSSQFGIPAYFVYAIMTVESAFHPGAVSVASAYGLVQVIPKTGDNLARELGFVEFAPERLLDPPVSIYFGGYYLARLLARFHGQEPLAAAAYNAGPHRVATWLMARGKIPMDMFIEDIPYDQARGYVKTVLEHLHAYRRIYHGEEHLYVRNDIDATMGDAPNY